MKRRFLSLVAGPAAFAVLLAAAPASAAEDDSLLLRSALIPKREIGQPEFRRDHPEADGRGVVIAIFDTGVDPAAAGLGITPTGERKILDLHDASGSGDVPLRPPVEPQDGNTLAGLSGRTLTLPPGLENPDGVFRLGLKAAREIFPRRALQRLKDHEADLWAAERSRLRAERSRREATTGAAWRDKAPIDRTRPERDAAAREEALEALEERFLADAPPIHYDCVTWHDGRHWNVLVDTDRDGDLREETALRPFGVAGEYAVFDAVSNLSFAVQVYEDGDLLSLVTVSGTHGTHVASIAAAHFPDAPERDGIAPGARIVSIRIGDPRTRGSSYGTSERRAMALAAQLGVDIVNASWGGHSVYQDGRDANSRSYDSLVERYGIFAVVSAGNDGPALSTAGSAGGEARRVLGVGASVSPEMGRVLYSTLEEGREAALEFTSRGPTKDGDWGVDVMAPGAAVASYSRESLQRVEMANGTSMAAPSAAGAAALLLSAARQEGLEAEPARLRAAIMLGARPVVEEDVPTQGAGMIHLGAAWERLRALQGEPAFGAFYDLEVSGGTFAEWGRGFYLRETDPEPRHRVVVGVQPAWSEAVTAAAQADFEAGLTLHSTVDWIDVPDYFHLANAENHFVAHVTVPPEEASRGSIRVGAVEARLAGRPELGPVFAIPFTVVRGMDEEAFLRQPLETVVELRPAQTERWFLEVPSGAEHLRLRVRHEAEDPIARRFVIHGVTLAREVPIYDSGDPRYMRLDANEERFFDLPTRGGQVMELALAQYWSSVGESRLDLELEWQGLGLEGRALTFTPNAEWAQLPLQSLAEETVAVKSELTHAVDVYLPQTTRLVAFDERGELPASPDTPTARRQMRQEQQFELSFEEATEAVLWYAQSYDTSEFFGGGLTEVIHESGEILYTGVPHEEAKVAFPAGRSLVRRSFNQMEEAKLEETTRWPLVLRRKLESPLPLPVFASLRERFEGSSGDELELKAGSPEVLFLRDAAVAKAVKVEPEPAYFHGTVTFSDELERTLGEVPVIYFRGRDPDAVANQEPEAEEAPDLKSAAGKLEDSLFQRRLEFVREQRTAEKEETRTKRDEVLAALRETRPEAPAPVFELALSRALEAGLAGPWWEGAEAPEADAAAAGDVLEQLDQARMLTRPDEIARFFGAEPHAAPGEVEARHEHERQKKSLAEAREVLVLIEQLRADVYRATGDRAAAWTALVEAGRWSPSSADRERARRIELALHRGEAHYGLALQSLTALLEDAPFDEALWRERAELYRLLGWDRFARRDEQTLALRAATREAWGL